MDMGLHMYCAHPTATITHPTPPKYPTHPSPPLYMHWPNQVYQSLLGYDFILLGIPLLERDAEILEELRQTFRAFVAEQCAHLDQPPLRPLCAPSAPTPSPRRCAPPPSAHLSPPLRPSTAPLRCAPPLCPSAAPLRCAPLLRPSAVPLCCVPLLHPHPASEGTSASRSPTSSSSPPRTTLASCRSTRIKTTGAPTYRLPPRCSVQSPRTTEAIARPLPIKGARALLPWACQRPPGTTWKFGNTTATYVCFSLRAHYRCRAGTGYRLYKLANWE